MQKYSTNKLGLKEYFLQRSKNYSPPQVYKFVIRNFSFSKVSSTNKRVEERVAINSFLTFVIFGELMKLRLCYFYFI